jgi:hypothetical protein
MHYLIDSLIVMFCSVLSCYFGYKFQKIDTDYYKKLFEINSKGRKEAEKSFDKLYEAHKLYEKEMLQIFSDVEKYYGFNKSNVVDINERRKQIRLLKNKEDE